MPDHKEQTHSNSEELREQILTEFKQVHKLAPADYTENCTNVVMSIVEDHLKQAELHGRIDELENFNWAELAYRDEDDFAQFKLYTEDLYKLKEERLEELKSMKGEI